MNTSPRNPLQAHLRSTRLKSKNTLHRKKRGSTLLVALIVVAIVTAVVGVTLVATSAATRLGNRASTYIAAERAADGAVEYGFGIWKQRIFASNGAISTTAANSNLTAPLPAGFQYDTVANNGPLAITATDEYGNPNSSPKPTVVSLNNYPGWQGYAYSYMVSAKVTTVGQLGSQAKAGVRRRFQYVQVPIFQMMFFFNDNMEFYKPATMIVGGLVHTNANLWASSSNAGTLTFSGNVSYAGSYSQTNDPPYANLWSGWSSNAEIAPTFSNGGQSTQVSQVPVAQPLGLSMAALFNSTDSNGNNDGYQEIIQQPVAGQTDPPEIASRRMVNNAGIVVAINGITATVTTQNGTAATAAQVTSIASAFTGKTTIYDQRQGTSVDVANIDVSKLTPVLNTLSTSGGFNGVMYIVDNTPVVPATPATKTTPANPGSPNPKTIRLQNGGVLPDKGLTIASQNPVYIQGDYNTGTTTSPNSVPANSTGNPNNTDSPTVSGYTRKPSAVMGDAVMFLSNSWNDSNSSLSLSSRTASNTTYNTAVMAGFQPSSASGYSGGACNFPRFLENWSGRACTYYGSMVELFASQTFTGQWDTGNIYSPPYRRWNFDTNFTNNAPPGSLNAIVYTRGSWSKF